MQANRIRDKKAIVASRNIPYAMLNAEVDGSLKNVYSELREIVEYYKIYKRGAEFLVEGTGGDYVASDLRYKMSATLIKKEARFLFAEPPSISILPKSDASKLSDKTKEDLVVLQNLVVEVLKQNNFDEILIKAAKDCFIGKRVAGVVNFNNEDGITINFLNPLEFAYETSFTNRDKLIKFVSFVSMNNDSNTANKRIFKKKFTLEKEIDEDGNEVEVCYLEETIHDGKGQIVEQVTERQALIIDRIPAVIFINDGLLGEDDGESEVETLMDYESYYSKLSNADKDSLRKSMNPIRYSVDMDANTTANLSSSAGSFWDLLSDQNLEKSNPKIGMLESSMSYSEALQSTLDRIKTKAYEETDVPNISLETMNGVVTSGKALKSIYWPLVVRCGEKMKMWGPKLEMLIDIILKGSIIYSNIANRYVTETISAVPYTVKVEQNYPLPEDVNEEKEMDLNEVSADTMSRKTYMMKWRGLTETEAEEELKQIALERELLEESFGHASNEYEEDEIEDDMNIEESKEDAVIE